MGLVLKLRPYGAIQMCLLLLLLLLLLAASRRLSYKGRARLCRSFLPSTPSLQLSFHSPYALSFHSLPRFISLPSFPLEAGPLNLARGPGDRCKLPRQGLGRSPSRKLVATVSMIFPKLYQPQKSQPKQRRLFSRFLVLLLEWAQCRSIKAAAIDYFSSRLVVDYFVD